MWNQLLRETNHRPWPLPERPYAMTMTWEKLLFAHWPISVQELRLLIPQSLELDTYDGDCWIGVVPFSMRNVGPRFAPKPSYFSTFLELNVRTYVTAGGKPGVFFFSLDAANPLAVEIARRWYHLPYFNARMRLDEEEGAIEYLSERTHRRVATGVFRAQYRPTGPIIRSQVGSLDEWLTERYCLYAVDRRGIAHRGEIHHLPWPLQPAELNISINSVADAHGITLGGDPALIHYVERLDVVAWNPKIV